MSRAASANRYGVQRAARQSVDNVPDSGADGGRRRGKCMGCGRMIVLCGDGRTRSHGSYPHRCPGSGELPRGDAALTWILHHPSVPAAVVAHFWHLEDGESCNCEDLTHAVADHNGELAATRARTEAAEAQDRQLLERFVPATEATTRNGHSESDPRQHD